MTMMPKGNERKTRGSSAAGTNPTPDSHSADGLHG